LANEKGFVRLWSREGEARIRAQNIWGSYQRFSAGTRETLEATWKKRSSRKYFREEKETAAGTGKGESDSHTNQVN